MNSNFVLDFSLSSSHIFPSKVSEPNLVCRLERNLYLSDVGFTVNLRMDMCLKKIGLCAPSLLIILGSTINIIGKDIVH